VTQLSVLDDATVGHWGIRVRSGWLPFFTTPTLLKFVPSKRTSANDGSWPGLPVRGQRRQQPFEQMRAERLVLDAASSTYRPIAAQRASFLNVCKM